MGDQRRRQLWLTANRNAGVPFWAGDRHYPGISASGGIITLGTNSYSVSALSIDAGSNSHASGPSASAPAGSTWRASTASITVANGSHSITLSAERPFHVPDHI